MPRCHAHRFRHTFATWAIQQDARELDVQHLLGHAGPEMVRRYTASYRAESAPASTHGAMATRLVASEIDLTAGPTRASMLSMDPQERELEALIGLYLLRCEAEGKSPETQRAYRESLQRFCRFVHLVNGPRDVHELTPRLIYHFLASFAHLSLETRHRYFREVRCFFNWLIETDRLTTSPFRGIRNVRLPQRIVAPFTRAEIGVLLAACPPTPVGRRDRAIILVLLDTGIRCSELAQLRLGDFDATTQRIRVRHGKANKQRVVAFAERCAAAVELYFEERGRLPGPLFVAASGGSGRLTASATGLRPNGIKQMLRRLGRRAGVHKVHAHRFRHTFATWAIEHDARELDVQYLLGHASPDMVRPWGGKTRS